MHITINNASQFRDEFHKRGRANQFSYDALGLLFDYCEDVNPDMELDVVSICCEFSENTPKDIAGDYDIDIEGLSDSEALEVVTDYICENTSIVGVTSSGNVVYQQF